MKLADKLAQIIGRNLGYDAERVAVVRYGLIAIIQMLELFTVALFFGLAFHCLRESMILFWGVGLLRRSTGGAHCRHYLSCLLTSSLTICLPSFICANLIPVDCPRIMVLLLGLFPAVFVISLTVYRRAPVASPNKPIDKPEKIARLRKQCLITLILYIAFGLLLLFLVPPERHSVGSVCALCFVFWLQSFLMLPVAEKAIDLIDGLFVRNDG